MESIYENVKFSILVLLIVVGLNWLLVGLAAIYGIRLIPKVNYLTS